jgi:hypothetical protein
MIYRVVIFNGKPGDGQVSINEHCYEAQISTSNNLFTVILITEHLPKFPMSTRKFQEYPPGFFLETRKKGHSLKSNRKSWLTSTYFLREVT